LGRILNIPVHVVDQDNQLERVLYGLRHKKVVLVDTAGCGRNDPRLADQVNSINALGARLKTLLVLPASSQTGVLKAAYYSYKTDSLSACIFTKLDEADSLGGALSIAADKQLPVAYCASGQNIPEDIELADRRQLIRSAIDLAKQHTVSDMELSESYTNRAISAL
jgi:flagellar biosynthesis protein FlhF